MLKVFLTKNKLPHCWYMGIHDLSEIDQVINKNADKDYVLKMSDDCGFQKGIVLNRGSDLESIYELIKPRLYRREKIIMEELIPGLHLFVQSFIYKGQCISPVIAERRPIHLKKFSPFYVDEGFTIPGIVNQQLYKVINLLMFKVAQAIGFHEGFLQGELVIGPGKKIFIADIHLGPSPDPILNHMVTEAFGMNLMSLLLDFSTHQLQFPGQLIPKPQNICTVLFWWPPRDVDSCELHGIGGLDNMPGFVDAHFEAKAIRTNCFQQEAFCHQLGHLVLKADTRQHLTERVKMVQSLVKIVNTQEEPVSQA